MSTKCPPNVRKILKLMDSSDFAGLAALGDLSARESGVKDLKDAPEDFDLGIGKILSFDQIASLDKLFIK